jgi:excisionase family DNA binding protein
MKRGAPVVRKFLKVQEVATLLSVCRATVYRLLDEGRLQRVWVGTSIRVPDPSLAAYLAGSGTDVELLLDVTKPRLHHE